jgi:hypothetical protein
MQDLIFSGTAQIDIHDGKLLHLVQADVYQSAYELQGFDDAVSIIDFRGVPNPQEQLSLAKLTIHMTETAVLQLTLHNSTSTQATHMLWMHSGSHTTTPPHEQLFMQIAPLQNGRYAYLALCQIPQ